VDPALAWAIWIAAFCLELYRGAYKRGRRAGLAAQPPVVPCPPTPIVLPTRSVPSEPPSAPPPAKLTVRIGRDVVLVDPAALSEP